MPDDGEAWRTTAVQGVVGVVGVRAIPPLALDSPEMGTGLLAASRRPSINLDACGTEVSFCRASKWSV